MCESIILISFWLTVTVSETTSPLSELDGRQREPLRALEHDGLALVAEQQEEEQAGEDVDHGGEVEEDLLGLVLVLLLAEHGALLAPHSTIVEITASGNMGTLDRLAARCRPAGRARRPWPR